MSTVPPSWKAEFEGRTLHISGVVKYPNDFSTASFERVDAHLASEVVSYRRCVPQGQRAILWN